MSVAYKTFDSMVFGTVWRDLIYIDFLIPAPMTWLFSVKYLIPHIWILITLKMKLNILNLSMFFSSICHKNTERQLYISYSILFCSGKRATRELPIKYKHFFYVSEVYSIYNTLRSNYITCLYYIYFLLLLYELMVMYLVPPFSLKQLFELQ